MLFKKSVASLCLNSSLYPDLSSSFPIPISVFTQQSTRPTRSTRHACEPPRHDRRRYATVRDDGKSGWMRDHEQSHDHAIHGQQWPSSESPTPYEILGLAKGDVYNKARYVELVKLYHPDRRMHNTHDGVPDATKLERYRLVVTANDLISDPARRRLYDLYGAGWGSVSDMRSSYRAAERSWRREPGNASMNATWEDWECWYRARNGDGGKQAPQYMSNASFVGLVSVFVVLGAWGESTRAGRSTAGLLEQRERAHAMTSQEMQLRRAYLSGMNQQERVEEFVRQRECALEVQGGRAEP